MFGNDNTFYQLTIKIDPNFQVIGSEIQFIVKDEIIHLNSFQCPGCFQKILVSIESTEQDEIVNDSKYKISEEYVEELQELVEDCPVNEPHDTLDVVLDTDNSYTLAETSFIPANFTCEICEEQFQSQHTFRLHKNVHTDKFSCDQCEQRFANNTLLSKHKKRNHSPETIDSKKKKTEEKLTCPKCGKTFGAKVSLRFHLNSHSDKFRCNIKSCLKGFPNNSRLRRHLKSIHGIMEASLDKNEANTHTTNDTEWNDSVIEYEINSIMYENIDLIKNQENETVNKVQEVIKKQFVCETCGKIYSSNTAYFIHKQNHKPPQFECDYCGKKVHRKVVLKKHIITQHLKPIAPEFSCNLCQKEFYNKYSLISHALVHQDPKFVCDICFTRFKQSSSLKDHMRVHQGERPFKCKRCSRSFTTKWALKSHEMIYSAEKNHVCDICSKAFSRKSYLTAHLKIHQKPFICMEPGCGERFADVNELQEHKLIHKGLVSEISEITSDSSDDRDNEMYYEMDL